MRDSHKNYLIELFYCAVENAKPINCIKPQLKSLGNVEQLCVIGLGKAAVQMADVVVGEYGDRCFGAVVTRHGYTDKQKIGRIKIVSASHPIPDQSSVEAAKILLDLAKNNSEDIPVLFLISGGGSSLACLPREGLSVQTKIDIHRFLITSGASIKEINVVRSALSDIKGGRLANNVSSQFHSWIISDVVGDEPSFIASGPTVPSHSSDEKMLSILKQYGWPNINLLSNLPKREGVTELDLCANLKVIANAQMAIDVAIERAKTDGWEIQVIDYEIEGEARAVAEEHARLVHKEMKKGLPQLLFSGGELTVTKADSNGDGGPNQEYLLALTIALDGIKGVSAIACDTDGVDGTKDVAGAFIDENTLQRSRELAIEPHKFLANNDSYHFFKALDDLIISGPTHTNVNDFRVIMLQPLA